MTLDFKLTVFPRRRLAALITSTLLIQACGNTVSVPPSEKVSDNAQVLPVDIVALAAQQRLTGTLGPRSTPADEMPGIAQELEEPSPYEGTVWLRLRDGFGFYDRYHNEQIDEEIAWFRQNEDYLARVSERAKPYIYEIMNQIEARGLPMELALLPVVESAYIPTARSRVNAVGLWQFMGPTATGLGLKRDWWYDGRRDPFASTRAALDYLEFLHDEFDGDWLLAIAAYNAGQGTVQQALDDNRRRGKPTDFWSLSLPRETRDHVPRLLALAHVMTDPETNNLNLQLIPDEPYVASVDLDSQIDLNLAAHLAGVEQETIHQLNPGYLQWATHPDGPHSLWLPVERLEAFKQQLATLGNQRVTWDRYVIQPGDTLSSIARRFNTQVGLLQQTNNIQGSLIVAGRSLLIPRAYRPGDTLPSGEVLLASFTGGGNASTASMTPLHYRVKSGDSLFRIAQQYGVRVRDLTEWNDIQRNSIIRPGQELVIYVAP